MLHIVLVEDNPADARMLETALRQAGTPTEVTLLTDGAKAIDYFCDDAGQGVRGCDLLLLDLNLPKVSGIEVLERIRACEDNKCLPVVVMSGSSASAEVKRCYEAGANSYICKPTHLDEIFSKVSKFVAYWAQCVELPSKDISQPVQSELQAQVAQVKFQASATALVNRETGR